MGIPHGMDKIPHLKPANMGNHMGQQGIGCDIKRHA